MQVLFVHKISVKLRGKNLRKMNRIILQNLLKNRDEASKIRKNIQFYKFRRYY